MFSIQRQRDEKVYMAPYPARKRHSLRDAYGTRWFYERAAAVRGGVAASEMSSCEHARRCKAVDAAHTMMQSQRYLAHACRCRYGGVITPPPCLPMPLPTPARPPSQKEGQI